MADRESSWLLQTFRSQVKLAVGRMGGISGHDAMEGDINGPIPAFMGDPAGSVSIIFAATVKSRFPVKHYKRSIAENAPH
ncbi:MAG: hypothetical protein ABI743_00305 [bacterium]